MYVYALANTHGLGDYAREHCSDLLDRWWNQGYRDDYIDGLFRVIKEQNDRERTASLVAMLEALNVAPSEDMKTDLE